ncbi:acetyl-CoA C-acetyltransferase [Salinispira pacifica]|uniref:3-ketoacyl-CoA thiolase, Acetyl-CoA acetyltransferase n=1 Tax=Salinispira pacifica TaxID=1307761 RepID=V5WHP1_9SPIO|nr:acetyl-CoA C-acetyltransferase [Salinispira pacifica]AHC15347.1 3-ketoacyl-CoA thiolase, Acetyl-CoA acetyltransferase [Salinispira pacifica]
MENVYIVAAKRTAIGTFGGSFKKTPATQLAAEAIREVIKDAGVPAGDLGEVIVGNVLTNGQGMGPGRQASIYAGVPDHVPAYTVNILCGSGMKTIMLAADNIRLGEHGLAVAAGMENMSMAPFTVPSSARWGNKLGAMQVEDSLIQDGLTDVFNNYHMGVTAENIVRKHSISREEQDAFAAESQRRAGEARDSGRFKDEIVPVEVKDRRKTVTVDTDEHIRTETTVESLAGLKPAFEKEGTVTAGNASGLNDGGSAVLLASESAVKKYGLKPMAQLIATSQAALDPSIMGLAPAPAVTKVLEKAGMSLKEMELIELNEAFAAQSLGVLKELSADHEVSMEWLKERTNVNGGAIALGHPLGASGNRITVTLLHEMKKRGLKYGLASLCIGGGMATALIVKML